MFQLWYVVYLCSNNPIANYIRSCTISRPLLTLITLAITLSTSCTGKFSPIILSTTVFSRLPPFLNNFQFLSHSSPHLQRAVHSSSALAHLYQPLHPFSGLHLHLRSSWHSLDASRRVAHSGSRSWDSDRHVLISSWSSSSWWLYLQHLYSILVRIS